MPIEGFDYKEFAASMSEQAKELVPKDLKDFERDYILKTIGNYTFLAGQALDNDNQLNLTKEQAFFITQIIAEWSYYKSIDLVHSGILPQYWDDIMQKIAFTIFGAAKQAIIRKVPEDQCIQVIEHHVKKVYDNCIEDLLKRGFIDEEIKSRAENQSYIDVIARQAQEEQQKKEMEAAQKAENNRLEAEKRIEENNKQKQLDKRVAESLGGKGVTNKDMKLMSLALLLKVLSQDKVTTILDKFESSDSMLISKYMNMADLESHLDGDLITGCLKEMKDYLPGKRKLTKENILGDLLRLYKNAPRENIEKAIKNERPLVKRFIAQAYDGEYSDIPLKVADIVVQYIEDSVQQ